MGGSIDKPMLMRIGERMRAQGYTGNLFSPGGGGGHGGMSGGGGVHGGGNGNGNGGGSYGSTAVSSTSALAQQKRKIVGITRS